MNEIIGREINAKNKKEIWDKASTATDKICKENNLGNFVHSDDTELRLNPKYCKPFYRNWINAYDTDTTSHNDLEINIMNTAKIISDTITFIENSMKDSDVENDYLQILNELKEKYEEYLDQYIEALDFFNATIKNITTKINEYSGGDNQTFSFIQCNFIGTNLKIVLKYLKSALGKDIFTVGICFLIVGCSLILSISSTILLIIIINIDIDDKKKKELDNTKKLPEYMSNSEGRIMKNSHY